jgi:thioredoxin-dependent adenylylsulfate APS reductase
MVVAQRLSKTQIEHLANEYEARTAEETVEWVLKTYGNRAALVTSFQTDGMVLLDMAHRIDPSVRVITIDTGRLPEETYSLMDKVSQQYGINVEIAYPEPADLQQLTERHGINPFYRSVALRLLCCDMRKVKPMEQALSGLDAWISGLRRSQASTRTGVGKIELDATHDGKVKVNPLADWTEAQVWSYVRGRDLPYNELYDKGYTSIGCAPCTRAIEPGEDVRAGRWWWETGATKECGIHLSPGMRNGGHAGSGPHRGGRG